LLRYGEDGFEFLNRAESDEVGGRERWAEAISDGFGTAGHYIDVHQCKSAGHFAEECGFLVVGLDQDELDRRGPEFERNGRESGAGADVEDTDASCFFVRRG